MTLNLIGIGLGTEKSVSLEGLELIKNSDLVFLENYTSKLQCSVADLEELYGKKIVLADRDLVEKQSDKEIISVAKEKSVSLLIIGDVFGATTHVDIMMRAKGAGVKVNIVHGASVLTAVGVIGLELYKYGKAVSIPFHNENVTTPVEGFKKNYSNDLHTLFLFDLDPKSDKFMDFKEAVEYLISNGVDSQLKGIVCAALGSADFFVKYDTLENLKKLDVDKYPQCLVIPAKKLHFVEEEMLENWR